MFKNIIFDLDDTILDFTRGEIEGVTKILKKNGINDIDHGLATYMQVNDHVWEMIEKGAPRQELLNTRFSKALSLLGKEVDGAATERTYRQMLDHNFYTISGSEQLLTALKNKGARLLVGSNGVKETQLSRLQGSGLTKYFDDLFISEDVGYSKPDKHFFDAILQSNPSITPENTVMVGDRLQSDILGASRANIRSVWYNPDAKENEMGYNPTYTVANYSEMAKVIMAGA